MKHFFIRALSVTKNYETLFYLISQCDQKLSNTFFISCGPATSAAKVRDEADRHVRDEAGATKVDPKPEPDQQLRARESRHQPGKYSSGSETNRRVEFSELVDSRSCGGFTGKSQSGEKTKSYRSSTGIKPRAYLLTIFV